jgi:hypothetical protein
MALTMPFRRKEPLSAFEQAKEAAAAQVQQAVGALEQRLPGRRRASWWERPFVKPLVAVVAVGAALATLAALMVRQRAGGAAEQQADTTLGLASTRTEAYDAHRAEQDGGVDTVQQATKESFPASDPPGWGSGPDVPIIREGEHKETLPYQRR